MWILNEIDTHKKKKISTKIAIIAGLVLVSGYFSYGYFIWGWEEIAEKEIKVFTTTTWDLKTSISGDGKVLYKEDYNLNFPISWTVKVLDRQEWELIKAWDIIASLDTTYLELSVDKAEISLKKANADLLSKKNQYSSSDIKLSENQLDSVKANLENIKLSWEVDVTNASSAIKTSEISLVSAKNDLDAATANLELIRIQEEEKYNNKLEDIISVIWTNVSFNKETLLKIDILLWVTPENKDKNDKWESYLWAKDSIMKNNAIVSFKETNDSFTLFLSDWKVFRVGWEDLTKVDDFLSRAKENSKSLNHVLGLTLETLKSSIISANSLSESDLNSYINDYENTIIATKKELSDLVNAWQNADEQKTTLETKLATQQNIILSLTGKYKLAVQRLSETNVNLENAKQKSENNLTLAEKQIDISEIWLLAKTEGPSYSELAPFYTNIENAKKSLEEARKKVEDAVLRSPIDGKIVSINWNIWSFVWWDKDTSFATITNNNKFYVESYVEELDITRIMEEAKVYLTFDALDWVVLDGQVYYISDKSTTDNNGIVTYKVEVSFDPKDSWVREGMTTYVEYVTNEVKGAKIIPVWAVKPMDGKPSVQLEDGTWKAVITWFTDAKMVEIISGLEKGEKIIY